MYGEKIFYKPIAQFDLINGIKGIFPSSPTLAELVSGTSYNLRTDNGIQNFYVDTDVINGRMYYYAVVAYDRGEPSKDIYPSENTRFISKDALGNISTDINTVAIRPNAPAAGYVPPESGVTLNPVEGFTTVKPYFEVIDPIKIIDQTYTVTFNDSLRIKGSERTPVNISTNYSVQDAAGNFLVTEAPFEPTNGIVLDLPGDRHRRGDGAAPLVGARRLVRRRIQSERAFRARRLAASGPWAHRSAKPRGRMLLEIDIRDFAIIDHLLIRYAPGFNVLTGETGAGKSIVVDALAQLLGERAHAESIRSGAESASIEGIFEPGQAAERVAAVLTEYGIEPDSQLIVRREIHQGGRSTARANGRAVPVRARA